MFSLFGCIWWMFGLRYPTFLQANTTGFLHIRNAFSTLKGNHILADIRFCSPRWEKPSYWISSCDAVYDDWARKVRVIGIKHFTFFSIRSHWTRNTCYRSRVKLLSWVSTFGRCYNERFYLISFFHNSLYHYVVQYIIIYIHLCRL